MHDKIVTQNHISSVNQGEMYHIYFLLRKIKLNNFWGENNNLKQYYIYLVLCLTPNTACV